MSGFHTPGPWHHAGPIGLGQYIVSEKAPIAVAYSQDTPGTAGANAFLIAAAPDLLDALKEMIKGRVGEHIAAALHSSGRFCHVCGCNSKDVVHSHGCPVQMAENAISKAEGK